MTISRDYHHAFMTWSQRSPVLASHPRAYERIFALNEIIYIDSDAVKLPGLKVAF